MSIKVAAQVRRGSSHGEQIKRPGGAEVAVPWLAMQQSRQCERPAGIEGLWHLLQIMPQILMDVAQGSEGLGTLLCRVSLLTYKYSAWPAALSQTTPPSVLPSPARPCLATLPCPLPLGHA